MPPGDLFWHLCNFLVLPLLFGSMAALLVRLAMPRARWRFGLFAAAAAATAAVVQLGGLLLFGAEGRIATYVTMVEAAMALLGWLGRPR